MIALIQICISLRIPLVVAGVIFISANSLIIWADEGDWTCDIMMHATTSELQVEHCMQPPTRQGIRVENTTDDRQLEIQFGRCTFTPIGAPDIVAEGWSVTLEPGQALVREEG